MGRTGLRATTTVDLHDVRVAGALMLAAAVVAPSLPGHPGIPCPLRTFTGIPCPLCGMTTSVTALVHLHPGAALAANPAGLVAVLVAVLLLMVPTLRRVTLPTWILPVALVLMEGWELVRFKVL